MPISRRAATPAVAQKLLQRIDWWRDYTARNGVELNNNPSHGNKLGGLTTILEKSPGAVAKRSEEHTPELQPLMCISYDFFCLKQKIHILTHMRQSITESNHDQ